MPYPVWSETLYHLRFDEPAELGLQSHKPVVGSICSLKTCLLFFVRRRRGWRTVGFYKIEFFIEFRYLNSLLEHSSRKLREKRIETLPNVEGRSSAEVCRDICGPRDRITPVAKFCAQSHSNSVVKARHSAQSKAN